MIRQQLNSLPLGSKEEPVKVSLVGRVTLQDLIKALKESYQEAGPRFGIIPVPPWRVREREKKKSNKKKGNEEKESDISSGQGRRVQQRVILHRPVTIISDDPSKNCVVDLETSVLVIKGPGVTLQGVDIHGYGKPGLKYCETHGLVEVERGGDLVMNSCNLRMKSFNIKERDPEDSSPIPAPTTDCSVLLCHDGGRATLDNCTLQGSPLSYGLVARDAGTKVLLENSHISANNCSNVLVCMGASLSMLQGCTLSSSAEGFGLAAVDKGTHVFCKDTIFSGNSRDNVFCGCKGRVVLEGCLMKDSVLRSGLRAEGEGSIIIARESIMEGNQEHPVRTSWGAWASVRGCRFSDLRSDGTSKSLVEGPEASLVQDPSHGHATWRYLSGMEMPWSSMNRSVETLVV